MNKYIVLEAVKANDGYSSCTSEMTYHSLDYAITHLKIKYKLSDDNIDTIIDTVDNKVEEYKYYDEDKDDLFFIRREDIYENKNSHHDSMMRISSALGVLNSLGVDTNQIFESIHDFNQNYTEKESKSYDTSI